MVGGFSCGTTAINGLTNMGRRPGIENCSFCSFLGGNFQQTLSCKRNEKIKKNKPKVKERRKNGGKDTVLRPCRRSLFAEQFGGYPTEQLQRKNGTQARRARMQKQLRNTCKVSIRTTMRVKRVLGYMKNNQ